MKAQLAKCSKARLMWGQLSVLSNYFFLYLDYWAGDSVRATASQPCNQMRRGSLFMYTFTRLHAGSRISSITIDISYFDSSVFCAMFVNKPSLLLTKLPELFYASFTTDVCVATYSSHAPTSFSHGFLRLTVDGREDCPSNTVSGTSLIPGIGPPLVMSSTTWLKDIGYGAAVFIPSKLASIPL